MPYNKRFFDGYFQENTLYDFELYGKLEINSFNTKSKYKDVSVEKCAELCVNEESYLCRSFNYYDNDNSCYLYDANLVDKIYYQIKTSPNENTNHYSSIYIYLVLKQSQLFHK